MKTIVILSLVAFPALLHAQRSPAPPPAPRSNQAPAYSVKTEVTVRTEVNGVTNGYVYDQQPLPGYPALVTREQADGVVSKFKDAYPRLGSPRILVYVNRDLVDTQTGMRLTSRTETVNTTRSRVNSTVDNPPRNSAGSQVTINAGRDATVTGDQGWEYVGKGKVSKRTDNIRSENRYSTTERKETLTDRQTVRDIERLFGRPLRASGVAMADQGVATQLIANRPLKQMMANSEGEQARKDRDALRNITDVVIEILITSRDIVVQEVSGDRIHSAPDIQATAIRLSDSKIIGQASSRDVVGKDRFAGRIVRNFDVQEIAEATALALMEDMAMSAQ
ncbi:MAG: hypothetical protein H0X66_07210 [Verrucomicrobia bacterium]|nr:hypothetical protein [Verrucomicrobiota bacterium]